MASQVVAEVHERRSRAVTPSRTALHVCHIISGDLWAGAETQLTAVIAYLVQQPGVHVSAVLFNDGRLADELRRLDVSVTVIEETRTSLLGLFLGLRRMLREHPCTLVHVHKYKDGILGTLAARLAGVPLVVRTVHGHSEPEHGWSQIKGQIYDGLDRFTQQYLDDLVIAVSQRMVETLWESGYPPTLVTCIHNGLDLSRIATTRDPIEVRRELGIDPSAPLIGTAGRLELVKGHIHLVHIARRLLQSDERTRILVAGDGPLHGQLTTAAAALQVGHACVFPGSRRDIYDVVSALDIFVLPSQSEGLPMSLLEAMALSRPVVASDVGGIPEVIQHGINGLLVPPGDEDALARACLELLRNREYAARLGARARQTVEQAFSHERSGAALLNVYRSLAVMPAQRPGALL
jgi:glycosyltransferase involved in cell wall biosynthesis